MRDCIDLVAVEARYHKSCHTNFLPEKTPGKPKPFLGRPEDITMLTAFNSLRDWIEMEAYAGLYSLGEPHDKMQEISGTDNTYTSKQLKQKLLDRYGDHIYFSEVEGTTSTIIFTSTFESYHT